MFLPNKYTLCYFRLVKSAKDRVYDSSLHERHHIIPKSLGGGNSKDNIVVLTFREHYLAHLLLTKMVEGEDKQKMWFALWNMVNVDNMGRRTLSSKMYSNIRQKYLEARRGYKHSEETKAKIKAASPLIGNNPRFGEDNRMFEGYYITPWGKFVTAHEASDKCPINMNRKAIAKACKENEGRILRKKNKLMPNLWVGRTYQELGFGFEKVK